MNIVRRSHAVAVTIIIVVFIAYLLVPKPYVYASIESLVQSTEGKALAITEINWGGSSFSSYDEWIEIQNISEQTIDLSQYVLRGLKSNNQDIQLTGMLKPKEYFLIARYDNHNKNTALTVSPDIATSITIHNTGFKISLIQQMQNNEKIIDEVDTISVGPFAGLNSNNFGKASMERIDPYLPGNMATNWQTAKSSINLRPKQKLQNEFVLDLGSPKAGPVQSTNLILSGILDSPYKDKNLVYFNGSQDLQKVLNLILPITTKTNYKIDVTSNVEGISYSAYYDFSINTSRNESQSDSIKAAIYKDKQFVQNKNSFFFINDIGNLLLNIDLKVFTTERIGIQAIQILLLDKYTSPESLELNPANYYSEGDFDDSQFTVREKDKIVLLKSLNELTALDANKNAVLSININILNYETTPETNKDLIRVNIYNNNEIQITNTYSVGDIYGNILSIDFDLQLIRNANTTLEIKTLDNAYASISKGKVEVYDPRNRQETLQIIRISKDRVYLEPTPDGALTKDTYPDGKFRLSNIKICKGKTECKVEFSVKNRTQKMKSLKISFGYKNDSNKDYQISYINLNSEKTFEYIIRNTKADFTTIKLQISGDIRNIEIGNIKASPTQQYSQLTLNPKSSNQQYKSTIESAQGLKGNIVDILQTNVLPTGTYKIKFDIYPSGSPLTSNFSVLKILIYNSTGVKILDENLTEKEIADLNNQFVREFEIKADSRLNIMIKYFGTHKRAKTELDLSRIEILKVQ